MDRIIYTAMSGAKQTLDQQSVINNNLANVSTSGFRGQLMALRAVPVQGDGSLGTRVSVAASTPGVDWSAGPLMSTGRDLDVAVDGSGWIAIQDGQGGEAYTRRGDLKVDGNGLLLSAGRPVVGDAGPIVVPLGSEIFVGGDGTVSAIGQGQQADALVQVGRLKLVNPQPGQMLRGDDGLFRMPPNAQGEPQALQRDETVSLVSGTLEGSNVSAVGSMVAMIDNARRYDMQMKVIEDADENAQRGNNLLSLQG